MFACVYAYMCARVFVFVRVFACVCVRVCACTHACVHASVHVCLHVCTCVCTLYTCACMCLCVFACVYTHAGAHTCVCVGKRREREKLRGTGETEKNGGKNLKDRFFQARGSHLNPSLSLSSRPVTFLPILSKMRSIKTMQ